MLLSSFKPFQFEYVWQTVSYVSGYVLIIPVLLIILLMTNEFQFKTHRQNIIDGWSREQFIGVKLQMVLVMALISTLVVICSGFVFGAVSGGEFSMENFGQVGFFFLKALSYFMTALLFGLLIRKSSAVGFFFIYMYFENFVSQILDFVGLYLKKNYDINWGSLGDYLPMNASDSLLAFPQNPVQSMSATIMPSNITAAAITMAVFYLLLMTWWSVKWVVKKDL
jgi:hypothetical protein